MDNVAYDESKEESNYNSHFKSCQIIMEFRAQAELINHIPTSIRLKTSTLLLSIAGNITIHTSVSLADISHDSTLSK